MNDYARHLQTARDALQFASYELAADSRPAKAAITHAQAAVTLLLAEELFDLAESMLSQVPAEPQ